MSEIDRIRNAAGRMQIGPDSAGTITGLYVLDDLQLVIRNDSVYSVQMADQVDPSRTNPDLPNLNQKLFDLGSDSELIKRTLLTAGELFRAPYLADSIDATRARAISLDVIVHLVAASKASEAISADVAAALVNPITVTDRAAQLPTAGDLWPRFAAFFQSIEHAFQELYQLALVFFPEARNAGRYFVGLRDVIGERVGQDTNFFRFAASLAANVVQVRHLRDCIEHESENQRLIVRDFAMTPTGAIERPTIEVIHATTPQAKTDLALFCADLEALGRDSFEYLAAYMAGTNISPSLPLPTWVDRAPEDQRWPDRSDLCYLVDLGGEIVRLG